MRGNVAQDHHDGTLRVHPLGHPEVVDAVIGDDVRQVILWSRQVSIRQTWSSDSKLQSVYINTNK